MVIGNSDIQHGFDIKGELHNINHTIHNTVYAFLLVINFHEKTNT